MQKAVIISGLVLIYFTLLFLPNLPFVEYYYLQSKLQNEDQSLSNEESEILVGDICYLNALKERTKQNNDSTKDKTLPKSNNASNNLVYLTAELANFNDANSSNNIRYLNRSELLTFRYLQIPSPPPKTLS